MIAPPPAVIERIDSLMVAVHDDDGVAVQKSFTSNATIVDENSPFLFQGANAGERWWRSVDRAVARMHGAKMHAAMLGVTESVLDREGDDAYVILRMRITLSQRGKTQSEPGLWALTLHRGEDGWKVTSASWATLP